jgi:hypothetical protein
MSSRSMRPRSQPWIRQAILAICCLPLLGPVPAAALAQGTPPGADAAGQAPATLPPEQLDALVAPIALYPDELLTQTLVASTYPLEIIQLQQWLAKHPELKDKALADSVARQPWDPSIQSMAAVPEVVKRLADDVQWTTELGNAFLAQQADVMDAVQRMRAKAKGNGALVSNEQQKVDTQVVEQKTVIVVESTNPEVIYVPTYSPTVVYGPPVYPYPPIYYPPYPPGAPMVSFTFGVMMGAAIWGGSCCHAGWGNNTVIINNNNNFNRINYNNRGGNGNWQHNPDHRGGAPYGNKATASKYSGSARGQSPSAQTRAGTQPRAGTQAQPGAGAGNRPSTSTGSRGGADQIGSRDIPRSSTGARSSAMSGGSSGFSGKSARASSSRGSSSMRSRGGGGRRR